MSNTLRFDHLALAVYDAARTLHFYTEVLQLPMVGALSGDDSAAAAQRVQRWIAAQRGGAAAERE